MSNLRTSLLPAGGALGGACLVLGALATSAPVSSAQLSTSATPGAGLVADVVLRDVVGDDVGVAVFAEGADGMVVIDGGLSGLIPGEHGLHIHEAGLCDPAGDEPFSSAGAHHNPAGVTHGGSPLAAVLNGTPVAPLATPEPASGHAGDLGNIVAGASGLAVFELRTDRLHLEDLADADGSALVVHEERDDLTSDPAGNSGARVACGVIFAPQAGAATPVA